MRTTVDLPQALHGRASELARVRGSSLSAVVAELAARGLATMDEPVRVTSDGFSGLPMISVGRRVTSEDVAESLDEE